MLRLIKGIYFIFLGLVLFSCEYDLTKENYIELTPPPDTRVIDLNVFAENDTIKIFTNTELNYSINTNELDILQASFKLHNETWDIYSSTGSLSIDPLDFPVGLSTLTLLVYTNSGSGSIADNLDSEGYYFEKKWLIVLDGREAPELTPVKSITEDGILKITWEKCEQYNFKQYEISGSINSKSIRDTITNADLNSYIDSNFVAGSILFRVSCRTYSDHTWGNSIDLDEEPPQLYFENITLDSLRIYWDKSDYKAKYKLDWDTNYVFFEHPEDTSYTIAQPGFAERTYVKLYSTSYYSDVWPSSPSLYDYEYYILGNNVAGNWPSYGYNHIEDVFYTNTYDEMFCFDINTDEIVNSVEIDGLSYEGQYSCPTNSTKVAALSNYSIYIYENKQLQDPIVIDYYVGGAYSVDHFLLSDNDFVSYASNGKYKMIDTDTKEIVATIDIDDYPYYSKWAKISTSQDARYACTSTNNGIKLYNIENSIVNEIHSDSRSYRSAYFNSLNVNQLFLTLNDNSSLEIRDPSNFNLIESIDLPTLTVIENIDPETGYMLLTSYKELFLLDLNTKDIIFKIKCTDFIPKFYNNKLFSHSGYVLDISEYL